MCRDGGAKEEARYTQRDLKLTADVSKKTTHLEKGRKMTEMKEENKTRRVKEKKTTRGQTTQHKGGEVCLEKDTIDIGKQEIEQ